MTVAKLYIDPKKKKKDGTVTIYITVNLMYKKIFFSTGVSCLPASFDDKSGRIRGNGKAVNDDNLIIGNCLSQLNDIFVRYRLQNAELTPELLKREWKNPTRRINFHVFVEEMLKERKSDIAPGTYKQHKSTLEKLKRFRPQLSFAEIDQEFIEQYRRWLKAAPQSNDINTIHTALKNFKTYLNIAKRKGVIADNPFRGLKLRKADSDRLFLIEPELQLIWKRYEKDYLDEKDQAVLRHFLFMCFTGIRISDLKSLTRDNLIGNILVFNPVKTRNTTKISNKIPLNSYAKKLISDENSKTRFLFNCISEQKMNLKIKEIVKVDKIFKDLSNHCARHTFATLWLRKTHDVAGLQRILGHSHISMTMKYVHLTDEMVIEEMRNFDGAIFKADETKHPPRREPEADVRTN